MIREDDVPELSLFDSDPPVPAHKLARTTDVDTSHDAAAQLSTGKSHCLTLLRAHYIAGMPTHIARYPDEPGLTDHEAAHAAGIDEPGVCWWHRCSDLRKLGLIEWAKNPDGTPVKRVGLSGRQVRASTITEAGRAEMRLHQRRHTA